MSNILEQLQLLVGQESTLQDAFDQVINVKAFDEGDIGVSQMNELLLTAGFDSITEDFFTLICKGIPEKYVDGTRIHGLKELTQKVDNLRKLAALKYGNFKFAFKKWSQMYKEQLEKELEEVLPRRQGYFTTRTSHLEEIEIIPLKDRFLLGHMSGVNDGPGVHERREKARKSGEENLRKHLTFDHIDVYVATSMRRYRDYLSVGRFIEKVFTDPSINDLKLRYFDPTQTYSRDRFCEGLAESLMLKRAKCAIYCAQESDTLGKVSELAITLAQGKPVLAYVPKITDLKKYENELIEDAVAEDPDHPIEPLRRAYISYFPEKAMESLKLIEEGNAEMIASRLATLLKERFDERARELHSVHPLAMQVDLNTGVANGVLLVRNAEDCIKMLKKVLLREWEFDLEGADPEYLEYACGDYKRTYILKERITKSPFRIVIGDELLTNSFWNFYLK